MGCAFRNFDELSWMEAQDLQRWRDPAQSDYC